MRVVATGVGASGVSVGDSDPPQLDMLTRSRARKPREYVRITGSYGSQKGMADRRMQRLWLEDLERDVPLGAGRPRDRRPVDDSWLTQPKTKKRLKAAKP